MALVTVTYDDETHMLVPRTASFVVLDADEFDAFEERCWNPEKRQKPTESILRGAALLEELYGKRHLPKSDQK